MAYEADFTVGATEQPDGLLAADFPVVTRKVTILTGQNLTRGAVLGRVTASGKYILSLSDAIDGSQTPAAVLLQPADATAEDVEAIALFAGHVRAGALTIGANHTVATVRDALRAPGIHVA